MRAFRKTDARRSYASALRRGDLAQSTEQRDSWSRSRAAWPDDAQEHLREADQLDAQARSWERTPLQLLRAAPPALFALYRQRRAEHHLAQRAFIIANPGVIPDPRLRIIWLSRLLLAEPALDVAAYVDRTVRELANACAGAVPAQGTRGKGSDGGKTTLIVPRGAVYDPGAAQPRLRALEPWTDDQRPVQDVIAATMPIFVSMTNERDLPAFD